MISRVFPNKFKQIDMISISGHCIRFFVKICQTVLGIRKISSISRIFGGFSPLDPILAAWQPCCHCRIGSRQAVRGIRRGAQACDHRFSICKAARQPAFKLFAASLFFPKKTATYFGFRVIHKIVCQKKPF